MLKTLFEQFINEYEIYPYTHITNKEMNKIIYTCKSDKVSICFAITIDTSFPYRWLDIIDLVHKGLLHVMSIKVFWCRYSSLTGGASATVSIRTKYNKEREVSPFD